MRRRGLRKIPLCGSAKEIDALAGFAANLRRLWRRDKRERVAHDAEIRRRLLLADLTESGRAVFGYTK